MTKLTHYIRDRIVELAIKDTFAPIEEKNQKALHSISMKIYDHFIPNSKQRPMEQLLDMNVLNMREQVYINCAGMRLKLEFDRKMPVPFHCNSWNESKWAIEGGSALSDQLLEIINQGGQIEKDRNEARKKLRSMLNSFSTFKQMRDTWPEGAVYYDKLIPATPTALLPAVLVSDINKMLGLPKDEEPAAVAA